MKIIITPHSPLWRQQFFDISAELAETLKELSPRIEHIGSTSVPELAAKPIIDIMIGLPEGVQLDKVIAPLIESGYTYYEVYNPLMPYRRLFVKMQPRKEGDTIPELITKDDTNPDDLGYERTIHIHVVHYDHCFWERHIAYREYLKAFPEAREKYQALKMKLAEKEWENGAAYSEAKGDFIGKEEAKALAWYREQKN